MKLKFLVLVFLSLKVFSQQDSLKDKKYNEKIEEEVLIEKVAIDTVELNGKKILIFNNYSWEYMEESFSDEEIVSETEIVDEMLNLYEENWDEDVIDSYKETREEVISNEISIQLVDGSSKFTMPIHRIVFSKFGFRRRHFHKGLDIDADAGDVIYSAFDGKVRYAKYNKGGYGNLVIIRHANGLETYYAHLSQINVEPNQSVNSGEVIGIAGKTGRARGIHLHFETRYYDFAFNPEKIIDFKNQKLISENITLKKNDFIPKKLKSTYKSKTHKVKKGETLSSIAKRNGTTVKTLMKLNNLNSKSVLKSGKKIRVR